MTMAYSVTSMPSSIQPNVLAASARRWRDELETRKARGFAVIENRQYSRSKGRWGEETDAHRDARWMLCHRPWASFPTGKTHFPLFRRRALWYE